VRIFAQFILAPLVAVYLVILLIYLVKVVATATWPSGWIGYLVSSVAVAGLLSLVLLAPRFDRPDAAWVRRYARLFHALMLPAVVMLALAVQQRLNQYGVTEARYVLLVLTAWLALVVVLGVVRPRPRVWAIPASLCVLAFVTALGPWSSFAVSRQAQLGRLTTMLDQAGRLDAGRFVATDMALAADQAGPISRQLDYLFEHFGHRALAGRVDATLQAELDQVVAGTDSPRISTPGVAWPAPSVSSTATVARTAPRWSRWRVSGTWRRVCWWEPTPSPSTSTAAPSPSKPTGPWTSSP